MLECLPQLAGGCLNYWEAGNWALHDEAEPRGPKAVTAHCRVRLHVFGRSRHAGSPSWLWREAPAFPRFNDRLEWARGFRPLTAAECALIADRIERRMQLMPP